MDTITTMKILTMNVQIMQILKSDQQRENGIIFLTILHRIIARIILKLRTMRIWAIGIL
ncbi:hypothetical protein [uncultured Treponema sp.]|uniref:hypothetical protein n=1 Tax=uncultured Treponema sp. TaxID=162155 RepID=UPI00280A7D38|nr:hypothetical protein [uncultured Treponema sp.]